MPKRIKHESFKYAFLLECQNRLHINSKDKLFLWKDFVAGINFMYSDNSIKIIWDKPSPSSLTFSLKGACFYERKINQGNNDLSIKKVSNYLIKKGFDVPYKDEDYDIDIIAYKNNIWLKLLCLIITINFSNINEDSLILGTSIFVALIEDQLLNIKSS